MGPFKSYMVFLGVRVTKNVECQTVESEFSETCQQPENSVVLFKANDNEITSTGTFKEIFTDFSIIMNVA